MSDERPAQGPRPGLSALLGEARAPGAGRGGERRRAAACARSRSRGSGPIPTSRGMHVRRGGDRRARRIRSPSAACCSRSCCGPTATASRSSPASGAGARRSGRGCTPSRRSSARSTNAATAEIALIENIQREDLNAIEEAEGYRQLIERHGHTPGRGRPARPQIAQPRRQPVEIARSSRVRARNR